MMLALDRRYGRRHGHNGQVRIGRPVVDVLRVENLMVMIELVNVLADGRLGTADVLLDGTQRRLLLVLGLNGRGLFGR